MAINTHSGEFPLSKEMEVDVKAHLHIILCTGIYEKGPKGFR